MKRAYAYVKWGMHTFRDIESAGMFARTHGGIDSDVEYAKMIEDSGFTHSKAMRDAFISGWESTS